jgi:hypothetical protein
LALAAFAIWLGWLAYDTRHPREAVAVQVVDEGKAVVKAFHVQGEVAVERNDISFAYGDDSGSIAPYGSATADSKWLGTTVTYVNKSDRPVRIYGYSEDHPFIEIETRADSHLNWVPRGLLYCGFGAGEHTIAAGTSHSFDVWLPVGYAGQEYRVTVDYRISPDDGQLFRAVSEPHRLVYPVGEPF